MVGFRCQSLPQARFFEPPHTLFTHESDAWLAYSSPAMRMRGLLIQALPCACGYQQLPDIGTTGDARSPPKMLLTMWTRQVVSHFLLGITGGATLPTKDAVWRAEKCPTSTPKAPGFEPGSFGVRGWCSNHYAIHASLVTLRPLVKIFAIVKIQYSI